MMTTSNDYRIPCPYCSHESFLLSKAKDRNRKITDHSFSYYRCKTCGLVFLNPVPDDIDQYYPDNYYHIPTSTDFLSETAPGEQHKLDQIIRFKDSGRLLEIGPSTGTFAWISKQHGYEVQTIEMDAQCSNYLNNVAGIPTINTADTCGALFTLDPFDVIVMWQVIEHLPSPWETLRSVSEKVKLGGIVVLAAPNPSSFGFRLLGKNWPHLDAPRHLRLIPMQLLEQWMSDLGFIKEFETTNDHASKQWNTFSWYYTLRNSKWLAWMSDSLSQKFGHWISKLASPWERMEGNGATYTMVFRKHN